MYQQHDPHNFKFMLVLSLAQKMNTKLIQCTLFKRLHISAFLFQPSISLTER